MAEVLEVKNELIHVIDYRINTAELRANVDADLAITVGDAAAAIRDIVEKRVK